MVPVVARGRGAGRPNIVLVMSDQHRADALGAGGAVPGGWASTPNIDELAADGVRFDDVTCQGPLCMPARASFLTERYVRDHGVYSNWTEVPAGRPTYLHALREAGYRTAMVGKAHLTRDDDVTVDHVVELAGRLHDRGFDDVLETGDKFTLAPMTPYLDHLSDRGLLEAYRRHIVERSYQGDGERGVNATKVIPMWDATPSPLPERDHIDVWHGDAAVRWVEEWSHSEPFFLFVGFPGPHDPWDAPASAVHRLAPDDPAGPRSTRRPDLEGTGDYGRLMAAMMAMTDSDTMDVGAIRGMRRAYAAGVSVIDEQVGRIRAALEDRGMADDTWFIYTSDHGEMAGDHGLMSKTLFYDGAVRVPLVLAPPGRARRGADGAGRVVTDPVEAVDIPATIRAIAGAPQVPGSVGRSLLGHVEGDPLPPREVTITQNWGFAAFITRRHKLVVDEDLGRPLQAFDRVADPDEDRNLAADPACADLVEELFATLAAPFLATPALRPHPSPFR